MVNSFYADPSVGGDGSTTTDDSNASTGLGNDGFRTRLLPMFTNVVNIAKNALTNATAAAASATTASNAATSAINAVAAQGTSTDTKTVTPTALLTFTTQSGKNWQAGQWMTATYQSDISKWGVAQVVSYSGTSLQLQFYETSTNVSLGSLTGWNLSLAAPPTNLASGPFTATQQVSFTGAAYVASATGTFNDYNPSGWSTAVRLILNTTGSVPLTGLAGGADGRLAIIENTGAYDVQVQAANTGSALANRFAAFPSGETQLVIRTGQAAIFMYDGGSSAWRYVAGGNVAYPADIWKATNFGAFITPGDAANSCAFGPLTDAATIAWAIDAVGNAASVTLTASGHTVGNPTLNGGALYDGCPVLLELVQDATGGRTVLWGTSWDFGQVGNPSLNTAATKRTWVQGFYRSATSKIHVNKVWASA